MCYDNIRKIRVDVGLPGNNDVVLSEQFDSELTNFINSLTEVAQNTNTSEFERKKVAIDGKQSVMQLLGEKLQEYLKFSDGQCESIVAEMIVQYDALID
jgi:hypothetical protein